MPETERAIFILTPKKVLTKTLTNEIKRCGNDKLERDKNPFESPVALRNAALSQSFACK